MCMEEVRKSKTAWRRKLAWKSSGCAGDERWSCLILTFKLVTNVQLLFYLKYFISICVVIYFNRSLHLLPVCYQNSLLCIHLSEEFLNAIIAISSVYIGQKASGILSIFEKRDIDEWNTIGDTIPIVCLPFVRGAKREKWHNLL